ncbi:2-oxo acid dehydrogenase subunit E2 [Streptomyces sp. NBC_01142]|uniref:2-oxo acid dehydrogenase subunit E2 n=1 Tax=Streptomyces sp. NBC_01142 TaxID=2975865 RepID=UPI002252FF7A|nr:2-oxo acid dehydrogenase subunit E2 [Streptomyces sp. NBC_01142]MCX4820516.1 2-oxo acid dehydrogenase subunit E2 [Streptomyces sp. NBC_01142]
MTMSGDRARRHTRYFLNWARAAAPVHLGADVDMTRVEEHRAAGREAGRRFSVVSYLLYAAGRVVALHPQARAMARGGLWPRTAPLAHVAAKLALDRRATGGERVVLTAVLPRMDTATLTDIQDVVDLCRESDPYDLPGAAAVRLLNRLPPPLGELAFRLGVRSPGTRDRRLGTFAVSSLGHRAVDVFHSYGGTAVTFCAGRVADRAVVRGGRVAAAPVMRLGLTFDHRVLDGAAAADVLDAVVKRLEDWHGDLSGTRGEPRDGAGIRPARTGDRPRGTLGTGP